MGLLHTSRYRRVQKDHSVHKNLNISCMTLLGEMFADPFSTFTADLRLHRWWKENIKSLNPLEFSWATTRFVPVRFEREMFTPPRLSWPRPPPATLYSLHGLQESVSEMKYKTIILEGILDLKGTDKILRKIPFFICLVHRKLYHNFVYPNAQPLIPFLYVLN